MIRTALLTALLTLLIAPAATAQQWAEKMFKTNSHDFGTVARGAKAEFAFELTNLYEETIHIASVRSSCGCTSPTITKDTLKTWEKGSILATYNTRSFLGKRSATITVTIDKPYYAEVHLEVSGFIRGDVVFHPGAVELGEVEQGDSVERKIAVLYAGRDDWQILDVRSSNPNYEVELTEQQRQRGQVRYEMLVRVKPGMEPGYIQDELTVVTDDARNPIIPLPIEGRIISPLTVSPASLYLGVVEPGQTVTKQIVARGKQPFRVTDVSCPDKSFRFEASGEAMPLHLVTVHFTAPQTPGEVSQTIEIATDMGGGAKATCQVTATVQAATAQ